MVAAASSSSASSGSDSGLHNKMKRKYAGSESGLDLDSDSDSGSSTASENGSRSSDSDSDSGASVLKKDVRKGGKQRNDSDSDSDMDAEEHDPNEAEDDEVKVLSHKEQRRLRKKQKSTIQQREDSPSSPQTSKSKTETKKQDNTKGKEKGESEELPRRQNSIWVGNLAFRTTPDALRAFFADAGEVTRVNMPMKSTPGVKGVKESRGFAYVDFSTPEVKTIAITMSEKNLDGRRLLIKDGDDFTGRPVQPTTTSQTNAEGDSNLITSPNATATANSSTGPSTGLTKTAKKILSAQKQPACPCLFLGNLGFETTSESIREMFEGHARALAEARAKKVKKKERGKGRGRGKDDDDDLLGVEESEEEEGEEQQEMVEVDVGIKKVRMGTFEDSGLCKGFAFVDFTSTQHATAALINRRNRLLDGRSLVVEYASPDAARRGGYREKSGQPKRKIPKRSGENKYEDKKTWKKHDTAAEGGGGVKGGHSVIENTSVQTAGKKGGEGADGEDYRPKQKRLRTDDKNTKAKRPKPGAALALAQREKYAIVPSEGTRLTFS